VLINLRFRKTESQLNFCSPISTKIHE